MRTPSGRATLAASGPPPTLGLHRPDTFLIVSPSAEWFRTPLRWPRTQTATAVGQWQEVRHVARTRGLRPSHPLQRLLPRSGSRSAASCGIASLPLREGGPD